MLYLNLFIVGLFIGIIIFVSTAYSQSTPPLDKPIESTPADQLSESGRVQKLIDEKRDKAKSPDSDNNYQVIKRQADSAEEQSQFRNNLGDSR